jgi:hypothetical protein
MLATVWANVFADADGEPTDDPEPGGTEGEKEMENVMGLRLHEKLLMPAPWAVSPYFIFSHSGGGNAGTDLNSPAVRFAMTMSQIKRISKKNLQKVYKLFEAGDRRGACSRADRREIARKSLFGDAEGKKAADIGGGVCGAETIININDGDA